MGLDAHSIRFLMRAKAEGVDFTRTAMIGRQELHASAAEFSFAARKSGAGFDTARIRDILANGPYAEEFFRALGAETVDSFDHSAFEGATHIHDMNTPIPDAHKQRYTLLIDGGSLEHVFHFPTAIANCMEMIRVGGHFVGLTITNNFSGHGFYQFSPELFFRIFTPENGFELKSIVACEEAPRSAWYRVKDPEAVQSRGRLINRKPVYLLVLAQRTSTVKPFLAPPQQSDYVAAWTSQDGQESAKPTEWKDWVERHIPAGVVRTVKSLVGYNNFNGRYFEPYD